MLALAGVSLDFAVQSHQVFGQREIYELRADARARVNTVYMTAIFLGGAAATAISGTIYDGAGWVGVTMLGAGARVRRAVHLDGGRPAPLAP